MSNLFNEIVLACPNCSYAIEEEDIVEAYAVDCKNCGKFSHIDSCKTLRDY